MKACSVRQLKNDSSLREEREQAVLMSDRGQPEALIIHLDDESLPDDAGVRRALATVRSIETRASRWGRAV